MSLIPDVFHNLLYPSNLEEVSSKGNKFAPSINYSILITLATSNPDIDWNMQTVVDGKENLLVSKNSETNITHL
jgi:hypothetical protein